MGRSPGRPSCATGWNAARKAGSEAWYWECWHGSKARAPWPRDGCSKRPPALMRAKPTTRWRWRLSPSWERSIAPTVGPRRPSRRAAWRFLCARRTPRASGRPGLRWRWEKPPPTGPVRAWPGWPNGCPNRLTRSPRPTRTCSSCGGRSSFYAGRIAAGIADLRVAIRLARQGAAAAQLPRAHLQLAQLLLSFGDWDDAMVHADLALSLVSDQQRIWMEAQAHAALGRLFADRGQWALATEHVAAANTAAASLGTAEAVFTARIAEAALGRAADEPARIVNALGPLVEDDRAIPMATSLAWWPTLITALIDCGHLDEAASHIGRLESAAHERGLDLTARITGVRAQLCLANGDAERGGGRPGRSGGATRRRRPPPRSGRACTTPWVGSCWPKDGGDPPWTSCTPPTTCWQRSAPSRSCAGSKPIWPPPVSPPRPRGPGLRSTSPNGNATWWPWWPKG